MPDHKHKCSYTARCWNTTRLTCKIRRRACLQGVNRDFCLAHWNQCETCGHSPARWTKLPTLLPPRPRIDLLTCEGNANSLQFKNNMFRIAKCFEGSESKSDDLNSSNLREKLGKSCSENQWVACSLGCNHVLQLWLFKFKAKKKKSNTRIIYIYI